MLRLAFVFCALLLIAGNAFPQVDQLPQGGKTPPKSQAPPRSDADKEANREAGMSSSKNTQIDLSPPADDAKNHPDSGAAIMDSKSDAADVQEMRPWDPHRAAKNNEVGLFYFKRKNYRAALARFQEALDFKPNDAEANFHLAECYEKLNDPDQAARHYEEYLKILPQGALAPDAHKALEKLGKTQASQDSGKPQPK